MNFVVQLIAHEVSHKNSKDSNPLTPLSKKNPPTPIIAIVELTTKKEEEKGIMEIKEYT